MIGPWRKRDLAGQRIVLTGASSGIGAALAAELARHHAKLTLAARSADLLEAVRARLVPLTETHAIPTDVAKAADRVRLVEETVRRVGGMDVLINNAGIGANGPFESSSEECLRRVFEVNFFGTTELTRLALPHLRRGNQPMIVNVSSVIGRRAVPAYTEYCASKFAVCGWSEALRSELRQRGIRVLLIDPGLIETPFRDHLLHDRLQTHGQRGRGMAVDTCARIMVSAMRGRRDEVVITTSGKILLWLNRASPWLVNRLMDAYAKSVKTVDALTSPEHLSSR